VSEFKADGSELPKLIGCTVRMNQAVVVTGVIERVEKTDYDSFRVWFSYIDKENTEWYGKLDSRPNLNFYNMRGDGEVIVLVGNDTDMEQDSELVLFFADILCEHRVLGSASVNAQDLRQAREVVKAMESLVSNE
jgi:hypothetical protein